MKTSELKANMHVMGFNVVDTVLAGEAFYNIRDNDGTLLADVSAEREGVFGMFEGITGTLYPFRSKLAGFLLDYACTEIGERTDERRWNVVIGREDSEPHVMYTIWYKDEYENRKEYHTSDHVVEGYLNERDAVFTDSEFNDLIAYLKSFPDGDTYAKIAELGKREVKP